ncbi:hypothetical protein MMC26_006433 [Xylographa opegraphella]|nr:hypothetical protein [Xylographa opegraphella]
MANAWLPKDNGYFSQHSSSTTYNDTIINNHRSFKNRRNIPNFEIRGVNLGSMFIVETWMASTEWANMGCGSALSEFDCVAALGQTQANSAWRTHWSTWITEADIQEMTSYGLNTIRIPVGYRIFEQLVYTDSEHFPQGGLAYLEQVCGWATHAGMYIIIDLHGAPGAQVAQQPFTGQCASPSPWLLLHYHASTAGFYADYQYQRAYWFLGNMTELIFNGQHPAYAGVGMLEIVNEPLPNESLISEYYPNALAAIRAVEARYNVPAAKQLNIQMMDARWGAGNPDTALHDLTLTAYDDHRYLKYSSAPPTTQADYLQTSCSDQLGGNWPLLVGEWSLSPATVNQDDPDLTNSAANMAFYTHWWSAQVQAYEMQDGWVFWSWKTDLGDYRWDYRLAVRSGVIPSNVQDAYAFECKAYGP